MSSPNPLLGRLVQADEKLSSFTEEELTIVVEALQEAFPHIMGLPPVMLTHTVGIALLSPVNSRDVRFDLPLLVELTKLEGDLRRNARHAQETERCQVEMTRTRALTEIHKVRAKDVEAQTVSHRIRLEELRAKGLTDADLFIVGRDRYDEATLRWAMKSRYNRAALRGQLYDDVIWLDAMEWLEDRSSGQP